MHYWCTGLLGQQLCVSIRSDFVLWKLLEADPDLCWVINQIGYMGAKGLFLDLVVDVLSLREPGAPMRQSGLSLTYLFF